MLAEDDNRRHALSKINKKFIIFYLYLKLKNDTIFIFQRK
jgi:hypothetical protein